MKTLRHQKIKRAVITVLCLCFENLLFIILAGVREEKLLKILGTFLLFSTV